MSRPASCALALVLLTVACREEPREEELILRFGTSHGISDPKGGPLQSALAGLAELIYTPLSTRVIVTGSGPSHLEVGPKRSDDDLSDVARLLRHGGLVEARVVKAGLLLRFQNLTPPMVELWVQDGPFEVVDFQEDERLHLKRRTEGAVREIRVFNARTQEELWRRFLGGDVDVIPIDSISHERHLRQVPSVRLKTLSEPAIVSLFFNVDQKGIPEPALRRALALSLNRTAIAEAASGTPILAEVAPEDLAILASSKLSERRLRIAVHSSSSTMQQALLAIERGLSLRGVQCEFLVLDLNSIAKLLVSRDFDAFIFTRSGGDRELTQFKTGEPYNISNYNNPAYDVLVSNGEVTAARAVLLSDVPAFDLYRVNRNIAFNSRLCNVAPEVNHDLKWLADVRLCRAGESN